jgi:CheY-like chemotaxis protein
LRVLVVDDNATNRRILQEMLTNWRMRPAVVDSGAAALATLQEAISAGDPFALVVTDHQMPGMDGFTLARKIKQSRQFAKTTMLMLTSLAHPEDIARCRKMGVAAYLTKPVKQSDLLDTILTLFGKLRPMRRDLALPDASTRRRRAGRARRLRILVAEDNPVNRKLVGKILEKRGHAVVSAEHGRAALAMVEEDDRFDLVLMDVQMPEMDGFETTAAIRRREKRGRYIPIVAMTA